MCWGHWALESLSRVYFLPHQHSSQEGHEVWFVAQLVISRFSMKKNVDAFLACQPSIAKTKHFAFVDRLLWTNPKFGYRPLSCFQALNFIAIFETFYTFFVRTWKCFKGLNWRLERSVSRLIRETRIQSHNGPIMRPIPSPFPLPPPSLPHSTLWQC